MKTELYKLGIMHGVSIYCDPYHPKDRITIRYSKNGTEVDYIISGFDDITLFEDIRKSRLEYRKAKIEKIIKKYGVI